MPIHFLRPSFFRPVLPISAFALVTLVTLVTLAGGVACSVTTADCPLPEPTCPAGTSYSVSNCGCIAVDSPDAEAADASDAQALDSAVDGGSDSASGDGGAPEKG
jgi:hypothetical protein